MFSKDLELTIGLCYKQAREQRHEFMTVEHLLLALLDNPSAAEVLRAVGANLESLGRELKAVIAQTVPVLAPNDERDTQPTLAFQRVLQRAVYHVQSSGRKEVTGANVLVAIFGEKDSHAVYLLGQQDISRLDVVNYIAHGVTRKGGKAAPAKEESESKSAGEEGGEESRGNPLKEYAVNLNELALAGKIDPLVGREAEIERTIQVLCRRRKNNPLFVGEAIAVDPIPVDHWHRQQRGDHRLQLRPAVVAASRFLQQRFQLKPANGGFLGNPSLHFKGTGACPLKEIAIEIGEQVEPEGVFQLTWLDQAQLGDGL
ncbi:Clp protease N-terminal domain-containing protein [Synechococcus sp. H55.10]|uniref:Clp protease N-terminal domain-containing protein n=1 Tax=Synechococcus sp. H55.10 TaxID=2964503 RepID=UPI0039C64B0D